MSIKDNDLCDQNVPYTALLKKQDVAKTDEHGSNDRKERLNYLGKRICRRRRRTNKLELWAVVVAQLVERSLPTTEVRGSNPVIGKF